MDNRVGVYFVLDNFNVKAEGPVKTVWAWVKFLPRLREIISYHPTSGVDEELKGYYEVVKVVHAIDGGGVSVYATFKSKKGPPDATVYM